MLIEFRSNDGEVYASLDRPAAQRISFSWPDASVEDDYFAVAIDGEQVAHNDNVNPGLWLPGTALCDVTLIEVTAGSPAGDMVSRESIIEALRDAHRNDSAADAVEFVSDLVGWSAEDDHELAE